MAGETIALAEAFAQAFILKHDLHRITGRYFPLLMLIESKILFDVVTRNWYTTEARLIVDIAAVCEAYKNKTISNLGWIKREYNAADSLTKIKGNNAL